MLNLRVIFDSMILLQRCSFRYKVWQNRRDENIQTYIHTRDRKIDRTVKIHNRNM